MTDTPLDDANKLTEDTKTEIKTTIDKVLAELDCLKAKIEADNAELRALRTNCEARFVTLEAHAKSFFSKLFGWV